MKPNTARRIRYSSGAIALHWLIAAALLFEIGLGWRMDGPPGPQSFAVFQLHKSVGITILLLTLVRIAWRLTHRPPALPPTMKRWERTLAHVTHIGFYVALIGLPLSGWALVSTSKIAVPTFLYGIVPWPHLPMLAGLSPVDKHGIHEAAEFGHEMLVNVAYALFALHVAGALKHHFVERGDDLGRMLPAARPRLTFSLGLAALALAAALALGNQLPLGAAAQPIATVPDAPAPAPAPVVKETAPAPATAAQDSPEAIENVAEAAVAEPAEPARWSVDHDASSLGFVTSWGQTPVRGKFRRWSADIVFDPDALDRSSAKVRIDMASATTGSADTESALPGDDWFAVARFPAATFEATRFRKLGKDRYEAKGTLKLRDASQPVTLPFSLKISGDQARMSGAARIDRTRFGVGQGQWASTGEIPADVAIEVELVATRSADAAH